MTDLGSLLCMGFVGFGFGAAYATGGHMRALRQARVAGALVIECSAFRLVPLNAGENLSPAPAGKQCSSNATAGLEHCHKPDID